MPPPRNFATLVYDMEGIKDWVFWRVGQTWGFDEWKAEWVREKNIAIIQTHSGVTLWARLDEHDPDHNGGYYTEVFDYNSFYRLFKETCDFWAGGPNSADDISRRYRSVAWAQVSYLGVVWQVGPSDSYHEY